MEYQFRRGIYRPNAQRLSISLAPLVAQRSLLFRVKADLATKTDYSELTPTEELESPGLFVVTASASARIMSAALSVALSAALSSCSVYSQDSWQGVSPFGPPAPWLPAPRATSLLQVDTRRHAIAFSPSVQWEAMSEESDHGNRESVVKTPLQSAPPAELAVNSPEEDAALDVRKDACLSTSSQFSIPFFLEGSQSPKSIVEPQIPMKLAELEGGPATLKKRYSAANRVSKHAKAFGKAMSHLSIQPAKRDTMKEDARRLTTANIRHLGPEYKLPLVQIRVSPIRTSFIAKPASIVPVLPAPHTIVELGRAPDMQHAAMAGVRPRPPRSVRPATPSRPQRSTTPPPVVPLPMPFRKGHKRYNSSPAVAQFTFKGWDVEDMPPLPAMANLVTKANTLPVRPRAASVMTRGHVRAISVPFPVRQSLSQ